MSSRGDFFFFLESTVQMERNKRFHDSLLVELVQVLPSVDVCISLSWMQNLPVEGLDSIIVLGVRTV